MLKEKKEENIQDTKFNPHLKCHWGEELGSQEITRYLLCDSNPQSYCHELGVAANFERL